MIHPIMRLQVSQLLMRRDGLSAKQAMDACEDLIHMLASGDIFLVKGNWMNEDWKPKPKFDFTDIPDLVAEQEERHPWNSVELQ